MAPARIALVASALAVVSAQAPAPSPMVSCTYPLMDFSNTNVIATYDFTAAFNASGDYNWQDRNDLYVKNNTYTFQVRGTVPWRTGAVGRRGSFAPPRPSLSPLRTAAGSVSLPARRPPVLLTRLQVCSNTVTRPTACLAASPAPGYQVDGNGLCFELGLPLNGNGPSPVSFRPVDFRNPARGLAMTYGGGSNSYCPAGVKRSYTIAFWCAASFSFPSAGPLDNSTNSSWNRQVRLRHALSPLLHVCVS